jgi:hypothetical protein
MAIRRILSRVALVTLASLGLLAASPEKDARALSITEIGGDYLGTWVNEGFTASGPASLSISISGVDVQVVFDMDGDVFESFDPPAVTMTGTISGASMSFSSPNTPPYGSVSGSISPSGGSFLVNFKTVGVGDPATLDVTGTIFDDPIEDLQASLEYSIAFQGTSGPVVVSAGNISLQRNAVPEPGTAALVAAGLSLLGALGRGRVGPGGWPASRS